jgi:hypothetical protein
MGLIYLLGATALWLFSLLLLRHSVLMLRSFANEIDGRLPSSGTLLAVAGGLVLGAIWFGVISNLDDVASSIDPASEYPRDFAPGVLLASLLPSAVAILKFLIVAAIQKQRLAARTAISGLVVAVINLVASIATLITFAHTVAGS